MITRNEVRNILCNGGLTVRHNGETPCDSLRSTPCETCCPIPPSGGDRSSLTNDTMAPREDMNKVRWDNTWDFDALSHVLGSVAYKAGCSPYKSITYDGCPTYHRGCRFHGNPAYSTQWAEKFCWQA